MRSFRLYVDLFIISPHPTKKNVTTRKRVYHAPAHSFVKQWVQVVKACWQFALEAGGKNTAGGAVSIGGAMRIPSPAANDLYGLMVGTGADAVTISDYKLQTKIAHGTLATQIKYGDGQFEAFAVVGSTASFVVKRRFENASGATITVSEAGIYCYDAANYLCLARDVLATPQDVLNGQILELKYTFKTTV